MTHQINEILFFHVFGVCDVQAQGQYDDRAEKPQAALDLVNGSIHLLLRCCKVVGDIFEKLPGDKGRCKVFSYKLASGIESFETPFRGKGGSEFQPAQITRQSCLSQCRTRQSIDGTARPRNNENDE